MNRENDAEGITLDVTEKEYQKDLGRGFREDEVMKPGRHIFKRGGFLRRHGIASAPPKIRISVDIDQDIVNFFKERASNADFYQSEFNDILRELIEAGKHLSSPTENK